MQARNHPRASNAAGKEASRVDLQQCRVKMERVQNFMKLLAYLIIEGYAERALHFVRDKCNKTGTKPGFRITTSQLRTFRSQLAILDPVHDALGNILEPAPNSTSENYGSQVRTYSGYNRHIQLGWYEDYNIYIPEGQTIGEDWPKSLPPGHVPSISPNCLEVLRNEAHTMVQALLQIMLVNEFRAMVNSLRSNSLDQIIQDAKLLSAKNRPEDKAFNELLRIFSYLSPKANKAGQAAYDLRQWCKAQFPNHFSGDL